MNNIIDVSDESEGSQMDLFHTDSVRDIRHLLGQIPPPTQSIDCSVPESYIQKFLQVDQANRFLSKVLKEIEDSRVDKVIKRVYTKILEGMLCQKYLFDEHGSSTEADYIIKLHGPILEELFLGSDVRLVWGDTNSPFNDSTNARIDLRLTMMRTQLPDLAMGEFARATTPSKFYKDKLKSVLVNLAHLKQHIQRTKMDFESAKQVAMPFVITQGLESDVYALSLVDKEWCVVTKLADIDIPSTISEVKKGKINDYLNQLHVLKQHCIDIKDNITSNRQTCRSMRRLNEKATSIQGFFKKAVWVDPFEESSDSNEEDA